MKESTVIDFKLTYEEYLYIVTILERDLKDNKEYIQHKEERGQQDDILYTMTQKRVVALASAVEKMRKTVKEKIEDLYTVKEE